MTDWPLTDWDTLPEPLQLQLSQAALREASKNLAAYADALAAEIESGFMADRGGHEALRLFANLIRTVHAAEPEAAGRA